MRREVDSAAKFVSGLIRNRNGVSSTQLEKFHQSFYMLLCTHYQDHWFPEKPFKGSGFRCIRINHNMDPIIARAGHNCGLSESELLKYLPKEMTIWVDPKEVSYRFGEDGSIGIIYDEAENQQPQSLSSSGSDSSDYSNDMDLHAQQPSPQQVPMEQNQNSQDFIQACRDQLRYYLPESADGGVNYEYLAATFVAS